MYNKSLLDSRLFQTVFSSYPMEVLSDEKLIIDLIRRLTNQMRGISSYNSKDKFKLDLLENYLLYLNSKLVKSKEEIRLLEIYQKIYLELFSMTDYEYAIVSKIFKYRYLFFKSNDSISYVDKNNDSNIKALSIYQKLQKNLNVSNYELNFLFEYLTINIDTEDQTIISMQNSLVRYMLNNNCDYGIYSKNFLLNFFSHQFSLENGYYDIPIYICEDNIITGERTAEIGIARSREGIVMIKSSLACGFTQDILKGYSMPRDIKLLQALFHELQHIKQHTEFDKDISITKSSFIMLKNQIFIEYLSTKGQYEYFVNYSYREIETEANIFGWIQAFKVLNLFAPKRIGEMEIIRKKAIKEDYSRSIASQINIATNKREEMDYYNVQRLCEIVEKHPEVLNKYPALTEFFYKNGKMKSLLDLTETYYQIKHQKGAYSFYKIDLEVFDEFFKVIILNSGIKTLPISQDEYMATLFEIIYHLFIREAKNIDGLVHLIGSANIKDIEHFSQLRRNYIKIFRDYLIKNEELVKKVTKTGKLIDFDILENTYQSSLKKLETIDAYVKGRNNGFK